jgi:hypothetical protein
MELEKYKTNSHDYTAKASDIARQINFAGIGIIWIIRTSNDNISLSDSSLLTPLILISISLLLDFSQYLLGGILWINFYNKKRKEGISKEIDVSIDPKNEWRTQLLYTLYFLKFTFMFISFIFIFKTLFSFY